MLGEDVRTHYELDAVFDYHQHSLQVTETVTYVNNTPEELVDLVMVVEPNRWSDSLHLLSLRWQDGEAVGRYELEDDQMYIPLPASLAPKATLVLYIDYRLEFPEIVPSDIYRPQPYGYTGRQTNIVDWYPYFPPYQTGEGWLVHPHWGFGEHQVFETSDFDVSLRLAEPVENLLIAASSPAEQHGDTYTYHLEAARTFALSASDRYDLETTRVGEVDVFGYSFSFDRAAGQEALQNTADALQLYSRLFGPYPHPSLSVVEADFLDGMEYDGLFFLSHGFYDLYDGTPKGYLTFIAAHETAHQWWYGIVGNDQALEPWLDEALCTYMERIFYEFVYADDTTETGLALLDWWWYYRVDFYAPQGPVDGSIYDFSLFRPYRDSVYLAGARFFEDLRSLIGDEDFFAFLRDYALQNQGKIASAPGFFALLREHTGQDLDGLLEQYFQSIR